MGKILLFLFLTLQVSAQQLSVTKGVVVDSLKVSDTLDESFALYLPTEFEGQKAWPILFVFDDEGRGKAAAQYLRNTAEQQGYILVSSNDIDAQNGLVENVKIAARLLSGATKMLPIDYRQISTIGTWEGAKVATSIPMVFDGIHGVVAIGNQWVNFALLEKDKNFSFIGVVGDEQYTSSRMNLTATALAKLQLPSAIYSYEGDTDWPQTAVINAAVGSLTLEAMKKGLRPKNLELINELYQQDMARVNKMMSLQQLTEAFALLDIMEEKYTGLRDISEVKNSRSQLRRSRNFTQQVREQEEIAAKEVRLMDDFIYYFDQDIETENFENLGWWNYQKIQMDSLSQKGGAEGKMANRLKGLISEFADLRQQELEESNASLNQRLLANMIQTIFDPTYFEAYKNIISLSAQDNDFNTALFYLEEMLKHGYNKKDALYNIESTLGLKMTREYNWLIEQYLGSSRYYDND